jgi:Uma2 family endonuclease
MGTKTLMSAEEFLSLPDEPGKQELLDGNSSQRRLPKLTYTRVIHDLYYLLRAALPDTCVWIEAGYQLAQRGWLQPDVSVSWPDQKIADDWMQGAPMVAVEVISPTNRPEHIDKKTAAYLQQGAAEVWVVYPDSPSMAVFRKESWERVTESYRANLLGLTIDLSRLIGISE